MSAAATKRIRIGSGGIMLPNHSPLVIAEQFGTLEALFPGRVDLGLGRAPGTDMRTAQALRRNLEAGANSFPNDMVELQRLLDTPVENQAILAVPGNRFTYPDLAARLQPLQRPARAACWACPMPSPRISRPTCCWMRSRSTATASSPRRQLDKPYVMVGVMGVGGGHRRGGKAIISPPPSSSSSTCAAMSAAISRKPVADMDGLLVADGKDECRTHAAICRSSARRRRPSAKLDGFLQETQADEVIISMPIHDVEARLKSVELFAGLGNFMRAAA